MQRSYIRFHCLVFILIGIVLFLLLNITALLTVYASYSPKVSYANVAAPVAQLACPDIKVDVPVTPTSSGAPSTAPPSPSLRYCSPKYNGNEEGPYGSYIVLVGENFPRLPITWLVTTNSNLDLTSVQKCSATSTDSCIKLPPPQTRHIKNTSIDLFSWRWISPFPKIIGENYSIIAFVGTQIIETPPNVAFSLLTNQSPCIIFKSGNDTTNCSASHTLYLIAGSSLTITGANWTPGDQLKVLITAICANSAQCSKTSLFTQQINSLDSTGAFTQQVKLPKGLIGTFEVCAISQVQDVATPGSDTNTIANGTLSFGCSGDTIKEILIVSPALPPFKPTPQLNSSNQNQINLLDIFAGIALLPALASLLFYVYIRSKKPKEIKKTIKVFKNSPPLTNLISDNLQIPSSSVNSPSNSLQEVYNEVYNQCKQAAHELSQKKPDEAIRLAKKFLPSDLVAWEALLQEIAALEASRNAKNIETQAHNALQFVVSDSKHSLEYYSTALVYYKWLLTTYKDEPLGKANVLFYMGFAYSNVAITLPHTTPYIRNLLLDTALICFQIALGIYLKEEIINAQAAALHNIGNIYFNRSYLQPINSLSPIRHTFMLESAISLYNQVLSLCSFNQPFSHILASTHYHLGKAYHNLQSEDRRENLLEAIRQFEAAQSIYNQEQFYAQWQAIERDKQSSYQASTTYNNQKQDGSKVPDSSSSRGRNIFSFLPFHHGSAKKKKTE